MTAPEGFTVNTSRWNPSGPWWSEPHFERFVAHGLPAIVLRSRTMGHLCGYVAVPPGHPLHGKGYDDAKRADGEYIDVHGGLTYAEKCSGHVCHVPAPGESDDVWWFGFDAAHSGDISPTEPPGYPRESYAAYRDFDYMKRECERLAEQLAAVSS